MEYGQDHYLETFQVSDLETSVGRAHISKPIGQGTFPWGFIVSFKEIQLPESHKIISSLGRCYLLQRIPIISGSYLVFGQVGY